MTREEILSDFQMIGHVGKKDWYCSRVSSQLSTASVKMLPVNGSGIVVFDFIV